MTRKDFEKIVLQYYYSDDPADPGNLMFGMLPDDFAKEPVNYGADDSAETED